MSEPVVVQGTAVSTPEGGSGYNTNASDMEQHSKQAKCQDPMFAPLFYIDIIAIVAVAGAYGQDALNDESNPFQEDFQGYYYASIVSAIIGLFLSAGGLQVMMCIPQTLIKAALIFTVVMSLVWMVFSFMTGNALSVIFAILFFVSLFYILFL